MVVISLKKKGLALLLCVAAAAGCLYAAALHKRSTKEGTIEYVQANQAALEQFASGLLEDPAEGARYNGWQADCYQAVRMVEFIIKGTGIGSSTAYEGFYYSEDDRPIGFQGTELDFVQDGAGWSWREESGDNHERIEKITAHWYWFQMSF